MALTVTFGNGGAATVFDLQSVEAQNANALDDSTQKHETTDQSGSAIESGPVAVNGGVVDISFNQDTNAFNFDVVGKWNSVKNVLAESDSAENVYFKDFVQADVHLQGNGASTVEILNVKRANVSTGAGNDTVTISLLSNDNTWVNAVKIDTGAGNDTITVKSGVGLNAPGSQGITGATAFNGGNGFTDGRSTAVDIKAGAGDDKIDLSNTNLKSSTVEGGTGVDHIIASGGADNFVFHLGDMAKTLATDVIEGFDVAKDKLSLLGTSEGNWTVKFLEDTGDTIVKYIGNDSHKGEMIVLSGVDASAHLHDWFTV